MKKTILIFLIILISLFSYSQGGFKRYSYKKPSITIDYTFLSYNGVNYNWGVYFSFNSFNCRWLECGVVAGNFNPTIENHYLSQYVVTNNSNSLYIQEFNGSTNVASVNQIPFYARAYVKTINGVFYSENSFVTTGGNLPEITTTSVSNVGTYYASSGGNYISDGGSPITAKGVIWGYDSSVSLSNYIGITNDGSGTSSFSSYINPLSQNTTYYVKAYATNSIGTGYGDPIQFTTQQSIVVPTVSTSAINSIASTTAYSGGTVSYSGGGSIIEKGVCWNTTGTPNYNNSKTNDGSGVGSFTSSMTGLSPSTTYYVRAYAKASGIINGFTVSAVGYGQELSFTTTSSGNIPMLTTEAITSITTNSAVSGGTISSDGGSSILSKGVQWSLDSGFSSILGNTNDGTGSSAFTSNISGLDCLTGYYVRAYATNSTGTGYGNVRSFTTTSSAIATISGFSSVTSTSFTANCSVTSSCSNITSRGIIYALSPGVTFPSNAQICGSGTGTYDCTPYATLSPSTTYYVKSYAIVNGSAIYLSSESTVTTLAILPFDPCTLSVGDSYGGGVVAYIFQSGDPGYISGECHGIIAATSDQSTGIQWYNGTYLNISDLSSDLHAGSSNTDAILYVQGYNYVDYAAGLARSYTGGGFSDWCLPSLNDLIKLYNNRSTIDGFSSSRYWASGQRFASAIATMVDFSNGDYSGDWNKAYLYHVRAIRYF